MCAQCSDDPGHPLVLPDPALGKSPEQATARPDETQTTRRSAKRSLTFLQRKEE